MNRLLPPVIVAIVFLVACQNATAQVVLQDGDFNLDDDWSLHHIFSPADGTDDAVAAAEQGSGDGNPGTYATINQRLGPVPTDFPGNTLSWGILIYDADSYNPADPNLGPLTSVRIGWDARRSSNAPRRNGRIIAAFVRQDGFVWGAYAPRRFYTEADMDDWFTDDSGLLLQSHFTKNLAHPDEQPDEPDFSASGSPIFFGVASGTSCPPTSDCRNVIEHPTDLDNFWVEAGDQPVPGEFTITTTQNSVIEQSIEVDMSVARSRGRFGAVTVDVTSRPETATEGDDYGALNTRIQFADGEMGDKPVSIRLLGDDEVEGDETFLVELSNATGGATVASPGALQITIVDDDVLPGAEVRLLQTGMVQASQRTAGDVTTEFPFRFDFQATVVNDGPSTVLNLQVELSMPKEGLAAFEYPEFIAATNELLNCKVSPRTDPVPAGEIDPNTIFIFILCDLDGPLAPGAGQLMPTSPILVGYAQTVSSNNLTPPDYKAKIMPITHFVDANSNNNSAVDAPSWPGPTVPPRSRKSGSGAMSLSLLLLLAGLVLRQSRGATSPRRPPPLGSIK